MPPSAQGIASRTNYSRVLTLKYGPLLITKVVFSAAIALGAAMAVATPAGADPSSFGTLSCSCTQPVDVPHDKPAVKDQLNQGIQMPKLTRAEIKPFRDRVRARWTTPALATLERPAISPLRRAGLLTLRTYLVVAGVMVVVKIVQAGIG